MREEKQGLVVGGGRLSLRDEGLALEMTVRDVFKHALESLLPYEA